MSAITRSVIRGYFNVNQASRSDVSSRRSPTSSTSSSTRPATLPPTSVPTNQVPPAVVLSPSPPAMLRSPEPADDTDLLAIIGVPSAVLAVTILLFAAQRERHATPQYYSQGI